MAKRVLFISIITAAVAATILALALPLAAAPPEPALVDYYDQGAPPGLDFVASTVAYFNTDYWHYSGGYWLDGDRKEARIYDHEEPFWQNTDIYYDRPGMNIKAKGLLPEPVLELIGSGAEITVSAVPRNPDAVNTKKHPQYSIEGGDVYIYALPYFNVSKNYDYNQFVPSLDRFIPIVSEGYGWNVYSIYRKNEQIGELGSSFVYDEDAIEFTELLDRDGRLQSGKVFNVRSFETGAVTRARASEITIGNGEFNTAGAVGMWFQFIFDVSFYKTPPGDLEAVEIKKPETAITGQALDCIVTIRNNSQIEYDGAGAITVRLSDGAASYEKSFGLRAGEEKDVAIPWKAPNAPGKATLTAVVNPDRAIEESDYGNNAASREVAVATPAPQPTPSPAPIPPPATPAPAPAPLPDLSVTGFRDTGYTVSSVARSFVKVKNAASTEITGIDLVFFDGGSAYHKNIDLKPNEEKEVEFIWFTPETACSLAAYAEINPGRAVAEADYSNNRRNINIGINLPPSDLSVASIIPASYPAGKPVVALVEVRNAGGRDFSGADMVEVRLDIPAANYSVTTKANIGANQSQTIPFYWTAPPAPGEFLIIAEANHSRVFDEADYSNNKLAITAEAVANPNPPYGCSYARREWTETRLVRREYSYVYGPDGTQLFTPDGLPVRVSTPVYEDRDFYAEVTISARLTPGDIKSGYGVECEVVTGISTNYDRPNVVIPLQDVYAYLQADGYSGAIKLEPVPGTSNRWQFPVNPASVSGARVQYVPVSWPDGEAFRVGFTGRDAQSPGGAMCATVGAHAMVRGSMYEDDYTAPLY